MISREPNYVEGIITITKYERLLQAALFHKTPKQSISFLSNASPPLSPLTKRSTFSPVQATKYEAISYVFFPSVHTINHLSKLVDLFSEIFSF